MFALAAALLGACLTFLVLEAGLRVVKLETPSNIRFVPGKGITYVPGAFYVHRQEGYSEGRFNSHGFRDVERRLEKDPGVYRIAIFGDSMTEGLQVQLPRTYPAELERLLNSAAGRYRFEVLNFGQSGFGTTEELMRYLDFGVAFDPDLVVVGFLTWNDFSDNHVVLNRYTPTRYFVLDHGGNLVLDTSLADAYEMRYTFGKRVWHGLKRKSYLIGFVARRFTQWRRARQMTKSDNAEATGTDRRALPLRSMLNIYLSDPPAEWVEAFEVTPAVIERFRDEVVSRGSDFVLVTLTNASQVHSVVSDGLKADFGEDLDLDRPDRAIRNHALEAGIPHLELVPRFVEYHRRTGEYLHGFNGSTGGHWNEAGHALAAETLFRFLQAHWNSPDRCNPVKDDCSHGQPQDTPAHP